MTKQFPLVLIVTLLATAGVSSQKADNLEKLWFSVRVKVFDQYPFLYPLTKHIAGVQDTQSHFYLIDRKERKLLPDTFTNIAEKQHPKQTHFIVWKKDQVFLVNRKLQFIEIQPFDNFKWLPRNQIFSFRKGDFLGLMDTYGQVLAQPEFGCVEEKNGQIIIARHLKYGAARRDGSELIPAIYDEIRVADNGYFTVRQKDKTAVFAPDGRQLSNFEFDIAQVRPDGSFFARSTSGNDFLFKLYQKDGTPSGEDGWRRATDGKYTYWQKDGRKYAEQYTPEGKFISQKFPADSVFDYALAYYQYKEKYERPGELPMPPIQNGAYQDKKTYKVYTPKGKLLFNTNLEIIASDGSFFRTRAEPLEYGLLDIRGKEILKPENLRINILPGGMIYAYNGLGKEDLYDLKGNPLSGFKAHKNSISQQRVSWFNSGHHFIQRKDSVMVLDPLGKIIIQSDTTKCDKINQLLKIKENGKWALALPSGRLLTPFQFDFIQLGWDYYNCYSGTTVSGYLFTNQTIHYTGPRKILFVNNNQRFQKAKIIEDANGKKGICSREGQEIIPCVYDQILMGNQMIFIARKEDSCTVFTNSFQKIASFTADSVLEISYYHELIIFLKDENRGVFNPTNGKQLLVRNKRIQVYSDLVFVSESAAAMVYNVTDFEPVLPYEIDALPEKIYSEIEYSGQYIVQKKGKYGIIDTSGHLVIPFQYEQINGDLSTGVLTMIMGKTTDLYIPHLHKIFKSEGCSIHEARPFAGYYVTNKTFTGFIDYHLDWVIPMKYNYLQLVDRIGFLACSGNLFGALSLKGDTIVPFEYAELSYNGTSKKWVGKKPEPCRITLANGKKKTVRTADIVSGNIYNFAVVGKSIISTDINNGKPRAVTTYHYGLLSKLTGEITLKFEYKKITTINTNRIYIQKSAEKPEKEYAGLMDNEGNWLITPDSLLLDYLANTLIGCSPGKKYGLFDKDGALRLPLVYDDMKFLDFYHVSVRNGGKWAIANIDGTFITPFEFDFIGKAGQKSRINAVKNGKWGYIDKTGKEVVPFQYLYADEFKDNWGMVLTPDGYRLLNADGTLHEVKAENRGDFFSQSITYTTDTLPDGSTETHLMAEHQIRMFSAHQIRVNNVWRGVVVYEDLSKSSKGEHHFGMMDYAGKQLCPPDYDEIDLDYSNEGPGLHLCRKGKLWGYIDFDGREVIAPQFEHADRFWKGKARVTRNRQQLFIDTNGNILK